MSRMDVDALDNLETRINEYITKLGEHLSFGGAENFDQYKQYVGRVEGLKMVLNDIVDLRERYISE